MDIKQLRYFIAVAHNGSISGTASKIFISQQGLSMALLRLETDLSCQLLERTPEGMVLTEEGAYLLPRAEKLVAQFDELEDYFKGPNKHRAAVRVGCAFGAIPEYLADILFNFECKHPHYCVEVDECSDLDCDTAVENRKVELGFGIAPLNENLFNSRAVFSSPFCLLVNKNHPLAEHKSVSVEILRSTPVMIMNTRSKTNVIITQSCLARGFQPKTRYLAAEVIAIHRMVAANMGVGISVVSVAESLAHPDVVAIPFEEPDLIWQLHLFKRKDAVLSPGAKAFEQFVLRSAAAGKLPAARQKVSVG